MAETLFHRAVHKVSALMGQVNQSDMDKPTPCSEWDVRALINHMIYEMAWVEPMVQGTSIASVGDKYEGDLAGRSASRSWRRYAEAATKAAASVLPGDVAHLSYGDKPAEAYLDEVAGDLIVHGWDLAKAIGAGYEIDEATAAKIREQSSKMIAQGRNAGLFKAPLEPTADADEWEKLLSDFGREVHWKP